MTIDVILRRVADRKGVEPRTLGPPLFDAVDPEALEGLFRDTTGAVTFEYLDYTVTVDDEGSVTVEP